MKRPAHPTARLPRTQNLQRKRYNTKFTKRYDPDGQPYFWLSGGQKEQVEDTDLYEVSVNKNITISKISLSLFEME